MLEIKINKEIRDFKESFFCGLDLRQCVFSILGIGATVAANFYALSLGINKEICSWISIMCVLPFAFLGFFRYNGMPAEKFLIVLIKYAITPKKLLFKPTNIMMEMVADTVEKNIKEKIPCYD